MRLEQRDVVDAHAALDFARDDFADFVDAVPGDQASFHRLDEVATFLLRLLDRIGRYERASTNRGVIELPSLESIRSDRVDVTTRSQPLSVDDGPRRVRRRDGNLGLTDRLLCRPRRLNGHPEDGGHLGRERVAMRLVPSEAMDSPDGADRADRLQLTLRLPPRPDDADGRCIGSSEVFRRNAGCRTGPLLDRKSTR